MKYSTDLFIGKQAEFLNFLKLRYSLFHLSNIFFRDLHYGIMAFLEMNHLPHAYAPSEELTRRVLVAYEQSGILVRIDERTWMLNYAAFKKAPPKTTTPPKPATPAARPAPEVKSVTTKPNPIAKESVGAAGQS